MAPISFSLWPPNSSTRSSVTNRISAHLSSASFFSQRYGRISASEAALLADRIEEEAFLAASLLQQNEASSDIAVVQFYAKEASRLMLERLKKGPSFSHTVAMESDAVLQGLEERGKQHTQEVGLPPSFSSSLIPPAPSSSLTLPLPSPSSLPPFSTLTSASPESAIPSSSVESVFDISHGDRELLLEAAAMELFKPLSIPNTFSNICLSNKSFGEDAAKVAAKSLQALKQQLIHVNLSDIVASRPEEEALSVMSIFSRALEGCNLKSLDLSDNALGEKGIRAFSELLKSQLALEELYFKNNGISEEAAVAICELLPSPEKLRILHFHNNMTGDAGALALSELVRKAPALESVRFSSARVATEGGIALARALLSGSGLQKIDLRDNPFGQGVAMALTKPLKQHMDLKELYLSYLGFEDDGAEAVLNALQECAPGLQVLDLAGNDITCKLAKKLADCIALKSHLIKLNLSENELEDRGVSTVCKSLINGSEALLELDLSETGIGRVGAITAARAVSKKSNFRLLNINGNHIPQSGIQLVREILESTLNGPSVLGPLDDNEEDAASGSENEDDVDVEVDLQAQLGNIRI